MNAQTKHWVPSLSNTVPEPTEEQRAYLLAVRSRFKIGHAKSDVRKIVLITQMTEHWIEIQFERPDGTAIGPSGGAGVDEFRSLIICALTPLSRDDAKSRGFVKYAWDGE